MAASGSFSATTKAGMTSFAAGHFGEGLNGHAAHLQLLVLERLGQGRMACAPILLSAATAHPRISASGSLSISLRTGMETWPPVECVPAPLRPACASRGVCS